MRAWGITLLVGAFLTLAWISFCPSYTFVGATSTYQSGDSDHYNHLDAVTFFGGEIFIWAAACGCCLLRRELAGVARKLIYGPATSEATPTLTPDISTPLGVAASGNR
ncbi:MAG TPA: hypothetical protein VF595_08805 [Tepidisphaeraceae bacterium]|jgi:hypothetical protein